MTLHRPRVALIAVTATLAAGSLATGAHAAEPERGAAGGAPVIGFLDTISLSAALTLDAPALASFVDGLTPEQTGDLLTLADREQLDDLLRALTPNQLSSALDTLDQTELSSVIGLLRPAAISALLGAETSGVVLDGLNASASALLAGGTAAAPQVDLLVGQLEAVLASGPPSQPGQLDSLGSLLTTSGSLLGTSGLSRSGLTGLLTTANGILASGSAGAAAGPLQDLVTQVAALLDGDRTTTPGESAPGGSVTPARQPIAPAGPEAPALSPHRASIGKITVSKRRTSIQVRLSCPATAPGSCEINLAVRLAGRAAAKATVVLVERNRSKTITVRLSSPIARQLKLKGGRLTITAATAGSSLPAATRTVKLARSAQ